MTAIERRCLFRAQEGGEEPPLLTLDDLANEVGQAALDRFRMYNPQRISPKQPRPRIIFAPQLATIKEVNEEEGEL